MASEGLGYWQDVVVSVVLAVVRTVDRRGDLSAFLIIGGHYIVNCLGSFFSGDAIEKGDRCRRDSGLACFFHQMRPFLIAL